MEEKKPSLLAELFSKIDNVRLGIKEKSEAQFKRIVEHRTQSQKKQQDFLTAEAPRFNSSLLLNLCLRSNTYGEAIAGDTKGPAERREV